MVNGTINRLHERGRDIIGHRYVIENEILANFPQNGIMGIAHDIFQRGFFVKRVFDKFPSVDGGVGVVYVPVDRIRQENEGIARREVLIVLIIVKPSQIHANAGTVFLEIFGFGFRKLDVLVSF